ncbi:branched-chain amino acid ABC transporter permease [Haladaptatus sp. AB618]|uniref:branched-chain amino acid ABC transporter permease n=1 Tax=Haladaptatus sp. AB618 TaxID=2934173 RepID=UPI00209C606F|nr:branched-chain amino acid ABC transporter permease [Haladaptatus sp. AB618]MCO8256828.1 branched-chain amino acid ABC transporter permease [Haladaptatus sp. AB618]
MWNSITDPSVVINGLLIGGVYAAMAIGFTMIWGVVGVINLAQGDLLMLGAFTTWTTVGTISATNHPSFGLFVVGLLVSMVAVGVLGYFIQRLLVNQVMRTSKFLTLLLTFGLGIIIQQSALLYWGATPRSINPSVPGPSNYQFLGATIPAERLLIFVVAVLLTGIFYVFLKRTRTGRAIRAASQNEQAAQLVGLDIDHIYSVTFAISAAVVAVTGGLIGMAFSFQPGMGNAYTLKSFVVVVMGGLGSIIGALVGGLLLGLIEHLGSNIWSASIADAIGFTALVVFLLVRPNGLFGEADD